MRETTTTHGAARAGAAPRTAGTAVGGHTDVVSTEGPGAVPVALQGNHP
jgi:hypothetical protein